MTITYPAPPVIDDRRLVVGLPWDDFLRYMRWAWKPGQHIAMIGPTGEGKTTFAAGLLGLRTWVLALDPKGEDDTLSDSGFERVAHLPGPGLGLAYRLRHWQVARQWDDIHNRIAAGLPARLIVGGPARTDEQDSANQDLMRRSFIYAREAGGWTVYVDEFELISSVRMFNLGRHVERMLISARRDGTSVLTSFQAAAWVSKHATRQARFAVIWPTGDRDMIKSVASSMGRDWRELAAAVDELPPFHVAVIPRGKSGGPFICTSAPRLGRPARPARSPSRLARAGRELLSCRRGRLLCCRFLAGPAHRRPRRSGRRGRLFLSPPAARPHDARSGPRPPAAGGGPRDSPVVTARRLPAPGRPGFRCASWRSGSPARTRA